MKSHITTVEELLGKPKSELHAIFRRASLIAQGEASSEERAAAALTLRNVTLVLKLAASDRTPLHRGERLASLA